MQLLITVLCVVCREEQGKHSYNNKKKKSQKTAFSSIVVFFYGTVEHSNGG